MILLYLVLTLIINVMEVSPRFVEAVNLAFNSDLSAASVFWLGLLIAAILELITS